ncbi:MAG: hypothetical protein ACK4MM_00390 [Fervidobacterium sp.]
MDVSLTGLIAAMVVIVIVFAMISLIFDITLRVLNTQRVYSELASEVQRLVSVVDSLLIQSVWSNTISVKDNKIILDFFVPQGSSVVKQSKELKVENGMVLFDNKNAASYSSLIALVTFELENIQGKKFILMEIKPANPRFRIYTVPLLTGLTEGN